MFPFSSFSLFFLSLSSALIFSPSFSPSRSSYTYRSFFLSSVYSLIFSSRHSLFLSLSLVLSLPFSRFSMIQRSSRGSNHVPCRIQKRYSLLFALLRAFYKKTARLRAFVRREIGVFENHRDIRLDPRDTSATSLKTSIIETGYRDEQIRDSIFVSQWRSDWAPRRRDDV